MKTTLTKTEETFFTPELLTLFPDVTVVVDRHTTFKTGACILSSFSKKLQSILKDAGDMSDDRVLIFSGFSEQFGLGMVQLTMGEEICIIADTIEELEENIQQLKSDFDDLEVLVPEEFWEREEEKQIKIESDDHIDLEPLQDDEPMNHDPMISENDCLNTNVPSVEKPTATACAPSQDQSVEIDIDKLTYLCKSENGRKIRHYRCCFCGKIELDNQRWLNHNRIYHKEQCHLIEGPYKCRHCLK